MTPQNELAFRRLARLLAVVCLVLVAILAFVVISAIHTVHSTGILDVTTTEPSAAITITQANHSAAIMGAGDARVRLAPGDYILAATGAGLNASQTVHVSQQKTTHVSLNLAKGTKGLPSVEDVGFVNMDLLINNGLSTTEVAAVKTQFFTFDKAAKVVSIDSSSIEPGAHNPDSYDPFILNFTVNIDGKPYKAAVAYRGFDSAQLTLYDQNHQPLYSGPSLGTE
jgi:hypothetical protein